MASQRAIPLHVGQLTAEHKVEKPWMYSLGFWFLTYNSMISAYRSVRDPWALSFVVVAYFDLVGLFWCLRVFERSNERKREKLKMAVWILATALTLVFSHKVASIMPWPVGVIIWCLAAAATLGGFYASFVYDGPNYFGLGVYVGICILLSVYILA